MTGRERLLTALNNGKPDRLPCLIHAWLDYHLKNTMNGLDQFQAYDCIGMDPVIYVTPKYIYDDKIVYHLCGGVMPMLDLVCENGSDGLETMTPPAMGGDCDLAEAKRRVGDKLFFIGGFDQNAGFEHGNPALIREMVFALHRCCPNGGYICAPSDQFFNGSIDNLRAFANACRECRY